ncbi:MAG: hypothetical protein V8Q27_10270 [Eubacteriales bacterium]
MSLRQHRRRICAVCRRRKGYRRAETTGTYVWLETDNWEQWEEKLVFALSTM